MAIALVVYTDASFAKKRVPMQTTLQSNVYLDANATSPVLPAALGAATRMMATQFGNPSSSHSHGLVAKDVLEQARAAAVQVLGAGQHHLVFNSGATEGIQTAVLSALCSIRARRLAGEPVGKVLVYGATEHKAVPQALAHWNAVLGLDLELRPLPVDIHGQHDAALLAQWLPETALLCTMAANNETGAVSDLAELARLLAPCRAGAPATRPLWLVDGVQALGKLPLDLQSLGVDYAVFSGHKLYAPKGVGLLVVRRDAPFTALMAGGGQEGGLRSGTENMPGIAALGVVLHALQQGETFADHATLHAYRDQLEAALRSAFVGVVFNTPLAHSLPTTLNFSVPGLSSKTLVDVLDAAGVRVSAGSACSAAKAAPSDVLEAMGLPRWQTESAVRLSIGPLADAALVDAACLAIARCAQALAVPAPPLVTGALAPHLCNTVCARDAAAYTLRWDDLDTFMATNPGTRFIDLREAAEHTAGSGVALGNHMALNKPLSQMSKALPAWCLDPAAPVVLVCRSGNRSLKVAHWLQSRGCAHVRHVHGGLALRPPAS